MRHGMLTPPPPRNEPVLDYAPGSSERTELRATLDQLAGDQLEIPVVIGGERIHTGTLGQCVMPHRHGHRLATYHQAGPEQVERAVAASKQAWQEWARMPWESRASIFLKAADLLAGRRRQLLNAATMLGVSKTPNQAEIDAACELIDFFRFNVHFMAEIYQHQPLSGAGQWNMMEWRPLEGFVFAVTPFNFSSIAGNLPSAPALMGNTVIWKPASSAVYPAWFIYQLLEEAGLPAGVINFVPGPGAAVGDRLLTHRDLAGLHFTGSTDTFRSMWQVISSHIEPARTWPRIVGETGGKDFVFAHASTDVDALVTALLRGSFEYQGQKCSASSRAYVPASIWPRVRDQLLDEVARIKVGDVRDFSTFMGAVIDRGAYDTITGFIDRAHASSQASVLAGGSGDDADGYFVEPTVIEAHDPHYETMVEEVFGPVLTVLVYPDDRFAETLTLCDRTSPYALTGAVFARDRAAVIAASDALHDAAGNFYVNDKPTGAVVGQQPFGGGRASGTNDKAGSMFNLLRWVSPRTIKETFDPPTDWRYPYMD